MILESKENTLSNLDNSVKKFGYKSYSDYLASPQWQAFRERYAKADVEHHCLECGSSQYQLHHITYKRICRETIGDVVPLCYKCHKAEHARSVKKYFTYREIGKDKTNQGRKRANFKLKQCDVCREKGFLGKHCIHTKDLPNVQK